MRENVRNFVEMIADGKDVMVAANETGVIEMNTHDLLSEMSIVLGGKQFVNHIKCMYENFSNWVDATQALLGSKESLEEMLGSINNLDNSLKDLEK